MAENVDDGAAGHLELNLAPEEKRVYGQLFRAADPDGFGAVSGDVAVSFFERTKLPADVLGEIWQIADTENRGLLTPPGFSIVLRLIGHVQAGRAPSAALASQPGPLPRFEGFPHSAPGVAAQPTGPQASPNQPSSSSVRVPSLSAEKVTEFASLFNKSGAEDGLLPGTVAKQIFERARLPNDVLGRIWNLADTQSRGALDATEFAIAMHLLASYKSGTMRGVPQTLSPGLYEAVARRAPVRTSTGSHPGTNVPPVASLPRQFSGGSAVPPQSPVVRQRMGTPLSAQSTGDGWAITPADKAKFDQIFAGLDNTNRGFITGDQAVEFFGNARLPDETLAQIWDLADINSEGRLNRDEFAVAMYLIRQQRGTKEGRGNLPTSLPPALVPPMMRKQQAPPSQPTAPAFENAPITKPRSAAEDLFGLDASSSTPAEAPQLTGSSTAGGPFQVPKSTSHFPTTASPVPSSTFQPFIPSSSFGQSLAPQQTDASSGQQARGLQVSSSDDLLGDADPEVSQKLTNETSELANLSNQVGNLAKQTQDVQSTKASAAQELSQGSQQKKDFEARLSQLRTLYETEAKDTTALRDQLSNQRDVLKRLQQDLAMLDGGLQDLRSQRQQLATALEAESHEKSALNEKIKATNVELGDLKPQVEKMRSEARQQKGLVAISKKQLATLDAERDRLQDELNTAKVDLDEGKKRAEEQTGNTPQASSVASPVDMVSPAASAVSGTNPFFRRGTNNSEVAVSGPATSPEQVEERDKSFDSMFGPSPSPPTTSHQHVSRGIQSPPQPGQPSENERMAAVSPGISSTEPPAPPKSRQMTSAVLPFRRPMGRTDSVGTSLKVVSPSSRLSATDTPRAMTPSTFASGVPSQNGDSPDPIVQPRSGGEKPDSSSSPQMEQSMPLGADEARALNDEWKTSNSSQDIPGAFPQIETPRTDFAPTAVAGGVGAVGLAAAGAAALSTGQENDEEPESKTRSDDLGPNFDQYFGGTAQSWAPSEKTADFDSAFDNMKQPTTNGTPGARNEFPPIRELDEADSDDGSEAPRGFDDDFTGASPPWPSAPESESTKPEPASAVPRSLQARPSFTTTHSANSSLPEIEAQRSPPTYGESVPHDNPNQFPPEFTGLLPHRGDPTSPSSDPPQSPLYDAEGSLNRKISQPYAPEAFKSAGGTESKPELAATTLQPPQKSAQDDFDSAFADMTPAPVVDDDADDDFDTNFSNNEHTFDPTFESPGTTIPSTTAPSQSIAASSQFSTTGAPITTSADQDLTATNDFYNFSTNTSNNSQPPANTMTSKSNTTVLKDSEWDDMFASLDKPGPLSSPFAPLGDGAQGNSDQKFSPPSGPPPTPSFDMANRAQEPADGPSSSSSSPLPPFSEQRSEQRPQQSQQPGPGRTLSTGTEHDDPILKRLTAMGWSRDDSLQALEKFDYNIDKAADYLTFKS